MKKKNDLEGLENWATDVKKLMKNQPFVSDGPLQLVLSYWHDERFLPKFCLSIGSKQLFRYVFMRKCSRFVIPF